MKTKNSENLSLLLNEAVLPKFKDMTIQEIFKSCNEKQFLDFFKTICIKAIEKFWDEIENFEFSIKNKPDAVEFYASTATADDAGHAPGTLDYDLTCAYNKTKSSVLLSIHAEYEVESVEDNVDANNGYYKTDKVDVHVLVPSSSKSVEIDLALTLKALLNDRKISRLETEYESGPIGKDDYYGVDDN